MDKEPTPSPAPQPAAPSPAQEVGASLKAARSARGYSLESVCQHTRIPRKYLEALEAGRFDDLPAPVYLRSFLSGYCEYLELDMRPLWDKLHPAPAPAPSAASPAPAAEAQPAAHAAPPAQDRTPKADPHAHAARPAAPAAGHIPLETSPYFNALISALGAVVVSLVLAGGLAWKMAHGIRAPGGAHEYQPPPALQPLRPAVEPKLLVSAARADAWISVTSDEALVYAGRIPQGKQQEFEAKKAILLRASSAEGLDLTLNGAPYRLPRPDDSGVYRIEAQ